MTLILSGTDGLSDVDGSAGTPAIRGTDTNTGIFFPAADTIAFSEGGTEVARLDSSGNLLVGTTSASTPGTGFISVANTFGFKNRIINGGMVIDQRNAGASVTVNDQIVLDRFACNSTQASRYSAQRNQGSVTPPAGFSNYLGTTSLSAYSVLSTDWFGIQQVIEGFNIADLGWGTANAQAVTISFWVRSSLTGAFGGSLRNGGVTRSYPFTYTISAANTWEFKTITVAGDTSGTWATDNTGGIRLTFGLGAGATFSGTAGSWAGSNFVSATGATSVVGTNGATFYITGVQLERGSTATSFDFRPYGTELMLCQRYYQEIGASADNVVVYQTYSNAVTTYYLPMAFPVPMRAAPTGTVAGTWTTATVSAFSVTAGTNSFRLNITSTGAGNVIVQNNGAGSKLTFAIEL